MPDLHYHTNPLLRELDQRTDLVLEKYATELSDHITALTAAGALAFMEKVRDVMNAAEQEFLDIANEILERDNGETEGLQEEMQSLLGPKLAKFVKGQIPGRTI